MYSIHPSDPLADRRRKRTPGLARHAQGAVPGNHRTWRTSETPKATTPPDFDPSQVPTVRRSTVEPIMEAEVNAMARGGVSGPPRAESAATRRRCCAATRAGTTLASGGDRAAVHAARALARDALPAADRVARRPRPGRQPGAREGGRGLRPGRGRPFAAYAVPTILGELRRHFRDHVWNVRLPRGLQELTMRVDAATSDLTEELGRVPTPVEIADRLDMSVEEVLEAIEAGHARRTLSLDAPRSQRSRRHRCRRSRRPARARVRPGRGRARGADGRVSTSASGRCCGCGSSTS